MYIKTGIWFSLFFIFLFNHNYLYSQETDSIEIYLIDAYSTMEVPYTFKLSFYTSDVCKSKVILDNQYEYEVSDTLTDLHKTQIDLSGLNSLFWA